MGPLRPARPKRKKAAATTAPDKGATTTKALPLALLLLLLPTGAKCAHRNQTTCGHTSSQPPRFGVVKRLTASKTILETRQLNSPAHEPAKPAMPLEFRKQSMHLTLAQLNGNFANPWHLTTSPRSSNAYTIARSPGAPGRPGPPPVAPVWVLAVSRRSSLKQREASLTYF